MDNFLNSITGMESNLMTIIVAFIAAVIGGLISLCFYRKSGKQLKDEAGELRKLMNAMMILQKDEKGMYFPEVDDEGNLKTIKGMMKGESKGKATVSGTMRNATSEESGK